MELIAPNSEIRTTVAGVKVTLDTRNKAGPVGESDSKA
jgi:hypothetical protein